MQECRECRECRESRESSVAAYDSRLLQPGKVCICARHQEVIPRQRCYIVGLYRRLYSRASVRPLPSSSSTAFHPNSICAWRRSLSLSPFAVLVPSRVQGVEQPSNPLYPIPNCLNQRPRGGRIITPFEKTLSDPLDHPPSSCRPGFIATSTSTPPPTTPACHTMTRFMSWKHSPVMPRIVSCAPIHTTFTDGTEPSVTRAISAPWMLPSISTT